MKKFNKRLLSLLFLLPAMLLFAGCGDGDEVRLIMGTGTVAGTYYPLGGAMATVINNNTENISVTITSTGASAANIRQIGDGDADIAIAQNDVMYYAFTGTELFAEEGAITNFGTLMSMYPETVQVIVLADGGIYSVGDLAGQRVSVGALGSGVMANATQVLAAYGLGMDDISPFHLNFGDSASAMQDLQLDAFFVTAATPNTAVQDLATRRDLRIISLSEAAISSLLRDYAFYMPITITDADGYDFITTPVNTVAVQATLIASLDVDDDVAYEIVRALIENASEVEEGHARGAYISPHNAVQYLSVPFHPGALRFFQNRGYY